MEVAVVYFKIISDRLSCGTLTIIFQMLGEIAPKKQDNFVNDELHRL